MSGAHTADAAFGKWPGILQALGVNAKFLRNVHGPCPSCGGKDRFRFDDKGNGNFICSFCGAGDGFSLLQKLRGWDFAEAARQVDAIVGRVAATEQKAERTEAEKLAAIHHLLEIAKPLTPRSASLEGVSLVDLRSAENCRHSVEQGSHPALLAILRYPDGKGASIHRTFLTPDGRKAAVDPVRKIMPGRPLATSAVRLGPLEPRIGIAEGIETAICASKVFGLPVWAAISAGGMAAWVPPPEVREVLICADNDASFTGQAAAFALARRLVKDGLAVDVRIPETVGTDWADKLQLQGVA